MVDLQPDQLRALAAIAATGTFDAAARELGVTPSAVSQRMRALESAVGQVLVRRGRPAELTPPGQVLVRHARHLALQQADVLAELGIDRPGPADASGPTDDATAPLPEITLVVSGDALTTWALPAIVEASAWARLDVLREDEEHSIGLLRDGTAVAAVTSVAEPVPGCRSTLLGQMRYRPMASPAFVARWFPDGPTPQALAVAPVLAFDRKDDLQERYLRGRAADADAPLDPPAASPAGPPRHSVPASNEFRRAIELGMGWGMLPDLQSDTAERAGRLVGFDDARAVHVPQHWQQWRLHSASLDRVARAVAGAARAALT